MYGIIHMPAMGSTTMGTELRSKEKEHQKQHTEQKHGDLSMQPG